MKCTTFAIGSVILVTAFTAGCWDAGALVGHGRCENAAVQQYRAAPAYPDGFAIFGADTIHYVHQGDVGPDASSTKPLCTDDPAEARAWSDAYAKQAMQADFEAIETSDKYFEITRKDGQAVRVDRCSYVRLTKDDAGTADLGTLSVRPLTIAVATEAAEYLHARGAGIGGPPDPHTRSRVMSVTASETDVAFIVDLVVDDDVTVDVEDVVSSHETTSIDKSTGTITRAFTDQTDLCK